MLNEKKGRINLKHGCEGKQVDKKAETQSRSCLYIRVFVETLLKCGFNFLILKGIILQHGIATLWALILPRLVPGYNYKTLRGQGWGSEEAGAGLLRATDHVPGWTLAWVVVGRELGSIWAGSHACFEARNISAFKIIYNTNIYLQTYKNISTFNTWERDAQCDFSLPNSWGVIL